MGGDRRGRRSACRGGPAAAARLRLHRGAEQCGPTEDDVLRRIVKRRAPAPVPGSASCGARAVDTFAWHLSVTRHPRRRVSARCPGLRARAATGRAPVCQRHVVGAPRSFPPSGRGQAARPATRPQRIVHTARGSDGVDSNDRGAASPIAAPAAPRTASPSAFQPFPHRPFDRCGTPCKLGARCSVLGARCSVLGARCSVLGARCSVLGAGCRVPVEHTLSLERRRVPSPSGESGKAMPSVRLSLGHAHASGGRARDRTRGPPGPAVCGGVA